MDIVDQIRYYSDQAYSMLDDNNFVAASQNFFQAASVAKSLLISNPSFQNNQNLIPLIRSFVKLANDANLINANNTHNQQLNDRITSNGIKDSSPQIIYNIFSNQNTGLIKSKKVRSRKKSKDDDPVFSYQKVELLKSKSLFQIESTDPMHMKVGKNLDENIDLVWAPTDLMNGITTITGGSGSGKTQCLRLLAHKLTENNIPCIIFDLHGDIDIGIETISLDYLGEFGVNPMELTSKSALDGGPVPHINRLMNQFSYAVQNRFSSTQSSWLRTLLLFSYKTFGLVQNDPETWNNTPPDFRYLLKLIKYSEKMILESEDEEYIRSLDLITKSTKVAVENRLVSILEHPAFYSKFKVPIDDLKEKSFRILLKPLNTIDMQFLASDTIIRQLFAYFKSLGHVDPSKGDKKLRLFIIIDEVKVFTGYKGKINDPYHILNRIATEARKFGIGMILASQVLGHFGRDIRSNAATKIILRTMDNDETKRCSKEMKIGIDRVSGITKPGEGFIITSKDRDAKHIQLYNFDDIVA